MSEPLLIGKGQWEQYLLPKMANRHGLVAGATGTGKTVTLQVIAERFSRIGVPVFAADVKGDLSGISQPGSDNPKVAERVTKMGLSDFGFSGCPVVFWDLFGQKGHPVRTTISEMGPLLLSRILSLNEIQSGDNAGEYTTQYGNISAASVGAIQRGLLQLEEQGGERLFGEPGLNLQDFIQTDSNGRGVINLLASDSLMQYPKLYSTFLLWLLSELFEALPEVGDPEKPKLVFFFDEAHLLFTDTPQSLLEKIEQVVRLIRSKGVGVYFVTQNPLDIPDTVLGQLGNRVQHALRAFTPRDQKAVRAAAETFRSNPDLDVETTITQMGVGEALISFLDEKGTPGIVDRALVCPPWSRIGAVTDVERQGIINSSVLFGHYEKVVDRESAHELLQARAVQAQESAAREAAQVAAEKEARKQKPARQRESMAEALAKSAAHSIGSQIGRQIIRGVLGSMFGGSRR